MSRTVTVTGNAASIRAALMEHGFEATYFDLTEQSLGSRVFFEGRRVGMIQADPVSDFGAATLTLDTGWVSMASVAHVLMTLGSR